MLIYGHRSRETLLGTRSFYCPQCKSQASARHIRVDRWLTLFFIPLFKIATLGELLECQACYGTFKPASGGRIPDARTPDPSSTADKSGCGVVGLIVAGLVLTGLGLIVGVFFVAVQLQDPGDNLTGFVGALALCPLPITIVGLLVFAAGLVGVWRRRRADAAQT
jgi:hypothetical protein